MRLIPTVFLLALLPLIAAADVPLGATLEQVRTTLGPARGQAEAADRLLLYYERGEVELQDGVVIRVALMPRAEFDAGAAQRAAEAQRLRDAQEIRRAELRAEGEALKTRQLADPIFRGASPERQVAFWEDFSRRYPDVPASEELLLSRLQLGEERDKQRKEAENAERLARLEARIVEAEARTVEAEQVARERTYHRYYPTRHRSPHPQNLWPIDYGDFNFSHPLGTPVSQLGGSTLAKTEEEKSAERSSRYIRRERERRR
jgi:PAS domain-containing protein